MCKKTINVLIVLGLKVSQRQTMHDLVDDDSGDFLSTVNSVKNLLFVNQIITQLLDHLKALI